MTAEDDLSNEQKQAEIRRLSAELRLLRGGGEGDEEPKPRPLRQSEILRAFLLSMVARSGGEHSTVRIARNARGDVQIEVAVRTGETDEVATIEEASARAVEIYDALAMLYPAPAAVRKDA